MATDDPKPRIAELERALEEARSRALEAQERYEGVMRASREALWERDYERDVMVLSPGLLELLGYDPGELPAEQRALREQLVHPDDLARAHEATVLVVEQGAARYQVELRLRCREGEYRWFAFSGHAVRADDGRVLRIIGQAADIHERKVAEIALRNSERMFRALFEGTSVAVTLREVDTQAFIDCNPAALRLYRARTRDELVETHPEDLAPPLQPDGRPSLQVLREFVHRARIDGSARIEWQARRRTGEIFPASIVSTTIALEDGRTVMQTMIEDVTDRRRAEETSQRRAAREELLSDVSRRFLDDVPETAIDAALERLGVTLDAERVNLFAPDEQERCLRCTHRWSASGVEAAFEPLDAYPLPDDTLATLSGGVAAASDAAPAHAEAWLAGLQREAGRRIMLAPVGYASRAFGLVSARAREGRSWTEDDMATLRAIGELIALGRVRREAELALAKAKEEAVTANVAKSAFLANMSHELRTPLNGVIGMVDLLAGTRLDDKQQRYAGIARASANQLLSVINDILDFSKIEAGRLDLETIEFELREIVDEVANILAHGAQEKGLELRCTVDPRLTAPLMGDPARLRQVLVNLTSNAIKFTSAGEVSLEAALVSDTADGVRVRVEVRDTGIGIPTEMQSRLFQPFTQADLSTTRVHGGTGLGLAICRELVERMGGVIEVSSQPGRGSTFWFEVPLAKGRGVEGERERGARRSVPATVAERHEAVAEPTARPSTVPAAPAHVLLVEDSPINAEVAGEILIGGGYTFDLVEDGLAAVEAARAKRYALVLMDCQLPGLDGYEATRRIRALENDGALPGPRERTLPIVALTASVTRGDLDRCTSAGMNDHIPKPVDARRLLTVVARHLAGVVVPSASKLPPRMPAVANLARALERLRGDRVLLGRISQLFAESAPETRAKLRDAVDRRDVAKLEFLTHRLSGQAASFDGAALVTATEALRDDARNERWSAAGAALMGVERELDRLLNVLFEPRDESP